ncbi:MAG: helix-turn-helix transcriptional regulator [Minicystis sp.]
MESSFGTLLRQWRTARRMSQEQLALSAEVSTRHISCVETGRAQPSREMVLVLAGALDVPLREQNALLTSAGYASIYRETDLGAPEMEHVRRAIDFLLARQEPYGAAVVDAAWNVHRVNEGAMRMFGALLPGAAGRPDLLSNVMRLLLHPEGLKPICVNWEEIVTAVMERAQREALLEGPRSAAARMVAEMLTRPDAPRRLKRPAPGTAMPLVVPIHLRTGDLEVRLFSTITTLGTPADVTAQELRIESWFPADDATERWIRSL